MMYQVHKSSSHMVRWPGVPISFPNGPGEVESDYFFSPLPVTAQDNQHILLFADLFSRRAAMYVVIAAEIVALGVANILVNVPSVQILATNSYYAMDNGSIERVNHNIA